MFYLVSRTIFYAINRLLKNLSHSLPSRQQWNSQIAKIYSSSTAVLGFLEPDRARGGLRCADRGAGHLRHGCRGNL